VSAETPFPDPGLQPSRNCTCLNVTNTYKQGGANCKSLEPKGVHKGKAWCYVKKGSCSDAVQGRYGTFSYMVCEPYWNRRDMGYKSDGTSGGSTANTPASAANAPTKATRSVARPRPGTTAGMKVRCTCSNVKNAHGQGDASCKAKEKGKPWCYVKKNSCSERSQASLCEGGCFDNQESMGMGGESQTRLRHDQSP